MDVGNTWILPIEQQLFPGSLIKDGVPQPEGTVYRYSCNPWSPLMKVLSLPCPGEVAKVSSYLSPYSTQVLVMNLPTAHFVGHKETRYNRKVSVIYNQKVAYMFIFC